MHFFSYQITYLVLVDGFDLKDTVWRVLKATFTTAMACVMNWRRVSGKIGLQRLVLKEVVIGENLFFRSPFYLYSILHNRQLFKTALQKVIL